MIPSFLDYSTSILNPILKLIAPVVFLIAAIYFFRARSQYGGEMGKVVGRLAFASVVGLCAMTLRYLGDVLVLWKWGESLGYVVFGLANVYAVLPLFTFAWKPKNTAAPAPSARAASH